jgi:hypothetical protein
MIGFLCTLEGLSGHKAEPFLVLVEEQHRGEVSDGLRL